MSQKQQLYVVESSPSNHTLKRGHGNTQNPLLYTQNIWSTVTYIHTMPDIRKPHKSSCYIPKIRLHLCTSFPRFAAAPKTLWYNMLIKIPIFPSSHPSECNKHLPLVRHKSAIYYDIGPIDVMLEPDREQVYISEESNCYLFMYYTKEQAHTCDCKHELTPYVCQVIMISTKTLKTLHKHTFNVRYM